MPYAPPDQSSTASYPTYAGGGAPFQLTGKKKKDKKAFQGYLAGKIGARNKVAAGYDTQLNDYFSDPTGGAKTFEDVFRKAAEGYTAPALRDFTNTQSKLSANIASRFGGNASTEEARQLNNSGDVFSRNLTEALSRLAPQAVAAGQARGSQLLQARGQAGSEGLDIMALIQQALGQKDDSPWARILGTVAGGAGGFAIGGPPGAIAGASVGQSAFG